MPSTQLVEKFWMSMFCPSGGVESRRGVSIHTVSVYFDILYMKKLNLTPIVTHLILCYIFLKEAYSASEVLWIYTVQLKYEDDLGRTGNSTREACGKEGYQAKFS
jgi:hypothetical protein